MNRYPIVAPSWYAEMTGPPLIAIDEMLRRRHARWLVGLSAKRPLVRGLLTFLASGGAGTLALVKKAPGSTTALLLEAALRGRRRRVVLLEFLPREPPAAGWKRVLHALWLRLVEAPAVRRAMRVGQVLTEWERSRYASAYGVPAERFRHIPWALIREPVEPAPYEATSRAVVSSGRASCDWETLFAAAAGADWPLTVICARDDLPAVRRLNDEGRAEILCELSRPDHDARLRAAAIYVLSLRAGGPSAGHVRLMAAVGAGTPVVATRVPGLDGYVEDGETAVLVPPADPRSLRAVIDDLLAHPQERERLRTAAFEGARHRTYREYFGQVRNLLEEAEG